MFAMAVNRGRFSLSVAISDTAAAVIAPSTTMPMSLRAYCSDLPEARSCPSL